jgi:putative ABC transport system permease protein
VTMTGWLSVAFINRSGGLPFVFRRRLRRWSRFGLVQLRVQRIQVLAQIRYISLERKVLLSDFLIDEYLAQKFFPDRDPIGQRLNQQLRPDKPRTHYTIVGIVPSVRHGEVGIAPKVPQIYWSAGQFSDLQTTLLVRTEGESTALLRSIRAAVRSIDPQAPIFGTRTMHEAVSGSIATQRLSAGLIGGFSLLALFLAALGLYGVLAYLVTRRTREIGIRIALGSPRTKIFGLILRQGMIMVGLGILAGIILAFGCGPLIQHFVYGATPHDLQRLSVSRLYWQ